MRVWTIKTMMKMITIMTMRTTTWRPFLNLTYVTLPDEDTNPILTDNANRAM